MKRIVFDNFKPEKILRAIEKIDSDEDEKISPLRLHLYMKKVISGQRLKEKKLRKVFLGIDEVNDFIKDSNKINIFYKNLIFFFDEIPLTNIDRWIFAIKNSLFSSYEEPKYHNILKNSYSKKLDDNIKFNSLGNQHIYKYIKDDFEMERFYIKSIYSYFIQSSLGIESIYEELGISTVSSFYYSSVHKMIKENILEVAIEKNNILYSKEFIKIVKDVFSIKDKDILFKKLLNAYYNNKKSPKDYNTIWFNYILEVNGRLNQKGWNEYSEIEKLIFKKWLNYKNIKDFFEKHAIYPDRKDYWYNWIDIIEEAVFIKEFKTALIMKFKEHLIIEFGEVGAVRVYSYKDLSIRGINLLFNNYPKTRAIQKINDEYQEDLNSRWYHQGNWQWKFNYNMRKLGYRI